MAEDDYIQQLYEQFLADVKGGLSLAHYERDDLLEIYDYACDVYDDYGRLNALMLGARDYPNDRELRERKAYYLYDVGDTKGALAVLEEIKAPSFLKELLKLRAGEPDAEEAATQLSILLSSQRKGALNDEEVIKLIETASDLKLYDWLEAQYDTIKQCAEFPDTVMYEISDVAEQSERYSFAIRALEDLTADQPLNEEYWLLLAELYADNCDNPDKALEAVDYALAINPRSREGLMIKARMLLEADLGNQEAYRILDSLMAEDAEDVRPLVIKAVALNQSGSREEAVGELKYHMNSHADSLMTLQHLLSIADDASLYTLVRDYASAHPDFIDGQTLLERISTFLSAGKCGAAASLLYGAFLAGVGVPSPAIDLMVELLYRAKAYPSVIEAYERFAGLPEAEPSRSSALMYALALYRTDAVGRAAEVVDKVMAEGASPESGMLSHRLMDVGVSYFMLQLREAVEGRLSVDDADPFA